jgi:undecaprenyl-diphosphatase
MAHLLDPGRRSAAAVAAQLVAALVVLFGLLMLAGWLVTGPEADSSVERADGRLTVWFSTHRVASLNTPSQYVADLGSTGFVIGIGLVAAAVAWWLLRAWWPVLLLAVTVVGELLVFLAVTSLVDRGRPPVAHLDAQLPPTSSFPSGHTAASVAFYGALAILLSARVRRRLVTVVTAVLAVAVPVVVAGSRMYRGMHHPTDVTAGLLLGATWLVAVALLLGPWSPLERRRRPVPA